MIFTTQGVESLRPGVDDDDLAQATIDRVLGATPSLDGLRNASPDLDETMNSRRVARQFYLQAGFTEAAVSPMTLLVTIAHVARRVRLRSLAAGADAPVRSCRPGGF